MREPDEVGRRRAIEVVMERRSDIDVDELADILAEMGTPIDEATLLADLDALGYGVDVADEDSDEPQFLAPPPRTDSAGPAAVPTDRRVLVGVGAVVLLVIAVAIIVVLSGGDDEPAADAPGPAGVAPSSTTAPREAERGDGLDPALDGEGVLVDDFARDGPGLGPFPDRGDWEILDGEWSLADGAISSPGEVAEPGSLAVIDPGGSDLRAQVNVPAAVNGSGIAFRVVDRDNYFVWATAPDFGTLALVQVVDGERISILDGGLAETGDNPALGINLVGTTVELLFDGAVTATYDDLPPAAEGERLGLTRPPGPGLATFDDVRLLTA